MREKFYYPSLKNSDFLKLLCANVITTLGFWLSYVAAFDLFVFETEVGPIGVSVLALALIAPEMIGGLVSGAIVDRFDRRRLIIGTYLACVPLMLLLAAYKTYWLAISVFLLTSTCYTISRPAYRTLIPNMVEAERLDEANGLLSSADSVAQILGPGIAGALLLFFAPGSMFVMDALTYALAAVAIYAIGEYTTKAETEGVIRDVRDGLRAFGSKRVYVETGTIGFLLFFALGAFESMGPYYVRTVFSQETTLYSTQLLMIGVGTLIGGLTVNLILESAPRWSVPVVTSFGCGSVFFVLYSAPTRLLIATFPMLLGLTISWFMATSYSTLSIESSSEMHGRIVGIFKTATRGGQVIGMGIAGVVTSVVGVFQLFVAFAVILFGVGILEVSLELSNRLRGQSS